MSKNIRKYSSLAALLVLFTTFGLSAQEQDPASPGGITTARGFSADKAFQMGDYDNINVFNGNLIVTLPVGPSFPVAGNLSYGVSLMYNSKIWPGKEKTTNTVGNQEAWRAKPEMISNAGFGWLLSMGRLYQKCDVPINQCLPFPQMAGLPTYESPDGALHSFFPTLHESGDNGSPAGVVGYTRDGTYLRLRTVTGGYEVDFPDGGVRKFGIVSSTLTQLTEIRDAFGNKVTLAYSGSDWVSFGDTRTGRSPQSRTQNLTTITSASTQTNFSRLISRVSFTAQGGRTLDYKFIYNNGAVDANGNVVLVNVKRGCLGWGGLPGSEWPNDDGYISVPLLTSVEVRDAAAPSNASPLQKYTFEYADSLTCAASALTKMTLPTGSAITWDYSTYSMPTSACGEGDPDRVMGVGKRTLWKTSCTDPNNSSCVQSGAWTYTTSLLLNSTSQVNCNDQNFTPRMVTATEDEMVNTVTGPDLHRTLHHFSVWNAKPDSPSGSRRDEYGLPFGRSSSRLGPNSLPRYISVEQQECAQSCTTKRASYVTYQRDDPASYLYGSTCNRRVTGTSTLFLDDVTDGVTRYTDADSSSFDGLGHFRTVTTTGNFTTAGDKRVETTNFNPSAGTYPGPSFVLPSSWLIQTFSEQSVEEHNAAAKKTYTWDSTTGAMSTMRTLKNSASVASAITTDSHDLLAVYCRDGYGNLTTEKYFGGDAGTVSSQTCSSTPAFSSGEYQINHSYSAFGPREKSWFSNLSTTQYFLDQTVSDASALPSSSRDVAGLPTTYGYDILGRLTSMTPPGAASTHYTYLLPGETYGTTTVSLPTVFVTMQPFDTTSATPLPELKYEFDTLGRVIRQSHLTPNGTWSATETSYDALGRKVWTSEPESTGASAPTGPLTATLKTAYTYDSFGRPKMITAADSSTTKFNYAGLRYSDRTKSVATGLTSTTEVTSKYNYDAFGRLVQVSEPSGPSTSASPVGGNVETNYGYDVGGRLSSVEMKGAEGVVQNRIFDYDRRGFLLWETHPESGMSTYTYDARGNVLTRRQAAASTQFDLNYTYDSAGRLRKVDGRNPTYDPNSTDPDKLMQFRPVKEFTYGDTNDTSVSPADYRLGKLATAVRYNYVPAGQTYYSGSLYTSIVRVTETYKYRDAAGRKTHRTLDIDDTDSLSGGNWMNSQTVDQDVAYNDLDLPRLVKYPTCVNCGMPAYNPERDLSPTYAQGQITSIPDFVSSISYWPNGMRNQLLHTNNIADTQAVDGLTPDEKASLARPKSISSGRYDACSAPVIVTQPDGGKITTSTPSVTMTLSVSGNNPTFQWYVRDINPPYTTTPISGATNAYLTVSPAATTSYFVAVTNACRTVNSNVVRVSVNECATPTVTAWLTLGSDRKVTLNARATGTEPFTYTWYRASDNSVIGNSAVITVGPISSTTSYYAQVTNACSATPATSQTISAVIPLTMPAGLVASKSAATAIHVTWPAATGAIRYHLERRSAGTWQEVTGADQTATWFDDGNLPLNTTYAYRVWASASTNVYDLSTKSNYSNVDVATTMSFTAVTSGMTVQAAHLDQLLQAVNAVRAAAGWSAVTWSNILASNQPLPSPGTHIVPAHILATRARINEALQALGVPSSGYTDPDPALKIIKAVHVTEVQLRAQ